ncbi:PAS domain S-box protein [Idiomarina loihiensis]|uniref:PAS domain S-box protein n=1 Tax=Idiomarina loihiensis TaxID=135577 RepID=UPI00384DD8BA
MKSAGTPSNEYERLKALRETDLLDSPPEERFDRLTRIIKNALNLPIALISLVDEHHQWLKSKQGLSAPETHRDFAFCAYTILKDQIFEVSNALEDERFADNPLVVNDPKIRFYAGCPIQSSDGHRIGTLCVIDTQPRQLSEIEKTILKDMAAAVQDEVRLTKKFRQTSKNEQRLQSILRGTNIGTWEWNIQTGETVFNERWANIVGYTLAELEPISIDTWMSLAHPEDLEKSGELLEQHFRGDTEFYDFEARMRHKEGHWVWVHDRGRLVSKTQSGEPLLISGTHEDITKQKHAEMEIKSQREFLEKVINSNVVAFFILDAEGNFTYANAEAINVLGLKAQDAPDKTSATFDDPRWQISQLDGSFFPPEELPFAVVRRTGQPVTDVQHAIHWPNGEWKAVSVNGAPLVRGDDIQYVFAVRDITPEVKSELALKASEAQFRSLVNNIPGVTYRCLYDEHWTMLYMSDKIDPLSGYPASDFIQNKARSYDSVIHPVDKERLESEVESAIEKSNEWLLEYRILHRDGSIRWAQEKGRAIKTEAGQVEYFDGFILDITQEKRNQQEMENQLAAFKALNQIASLSPEYPLKRINRGLELACSYLNLELGIVSRIDGKDYEIIAFNAPKETELTAGLTFPLKETYCEIVMSEGKTVAIHNMASSKYRQHPCYETFGLESYIGLPILVNGCHFGTLNFSSATARERPFKETEKQFLSLLARWVSSTLEFKQKNEAIENSESRLRGLFKLSPIGIALNDYETGKFIDLNDALLAPTGYTREEFISLSYWDITPRDYEEAELEHLEALANTGRYGPFEKEYIRKDGSRYPVLLNGMVVYDDNGRKLIWSIIEDISERKRNEEIKNAFVSTVSHELRTPITSITGALDLLLGNTCGDLPSAAVEMIEVAKKNSVRMNLLINDILDLEKLLAGRMEMHFEKVAINSLLADITKRNKTYAERFQVVLEQTPIDPSLSIYVDTQRFEQVMTNLISNAVKFSPKGEAVQINAEAQGEFVRIAVKDKGDGIPEEFQPRVFEKFAQANSTNTRATGGTGLGLSISKEIMDRLGGSISFNTNANGTEFFILLPRPDGHSEMGE